METMSKCQFEFLIVRFPNFMQTKSFKNFECFPRKWYLVPALMQTWMSDLQWIYALVQRMHSTAPWQCLQMIQMWVWISLREFVDCQSIIQFNWVISSNRSNHADQTRSFQRYKSLLKMIKFTQNCLILPTKKVVDESFKQNIKGCSTFKFHMIRAIRNWIWTSIEISSKVIDYL